MPEGGRGIKPWLLGEIAQGQATLEIAKASVTHEFAGQQAEQGTFAAAIRPN